MPQDGSGGVQTTGCVTRRLWLIHERDRKLTVMDNGKKLLKNSNHVHDTSFFMIIYP